MQNLVDSISLDQIDTLGHLTLLDSCKPKDDGTYAFDTIEFRGSVYGAVMACLHLIQLELPTEWKTTEMGFKVCVFCIYKLQPLAISNGKTAINR